MPIDLTSDAQLEESSRQDALQWALSLPLATQTYMDCLQSGTSLAHLDDSSRLRLAVGRSCFVRTVRTNGDGLCGVHAVFGHAGDDPSELCRPEANRFWVESLPMSYSSVQQQLGVDDFTLLRNVVAKFWTDFVVPYWLHEAEPPPPEEDLFLQALRSQFDVQDLLDKQDVISISIQKQREQATGMKSLRDHSWVLSWIL
jgi:hypothetical protein